MEEELNNALIIFEAIGLQYFSLKQVTRKNLWMRPSNVRTFYMIILLCLITGVAVWFVQGEAVIETNETITAKNILTYALQHSINVGFVLVIIVSLMQSYFTTPKVKKIYLNMKEIAEIAMDQFNIKKDFSLVRKSASKRVKVVIFSFLAIHFTTYFIRSASVTDIVPMLIGLLPIFYLVMIVYKFVFYVAMINGQMRFVLKLLEETFKTPPIFVKTVESMKINVTNVQLVRKHENSMSKLLGVRRIFNLTYENGSLINESNGLTILIVLVDLVIGVTAAGYQIFVIFIGGLPTEKLPGKIKEFSKSFKLVLSTYFQKLCTS
jgi:hypothetical protein